MEKRHFNTGAYDRLMTEAPIRMFGLIFMLRTEVEKLQTGSHVRQTLWNVSKKKNSRVAEHMTL